MKKYFESTEPQGISFAVECLRRVMQKEFGQNVWIGANTKKVYPERYDPYPHRRLRPVVFVGSIFREEGDFFQMFTRACMIAECNEGAWDSCFVNEALHSQSLHKVTCTLVGRYKIVWEVKCATPDIYEDWYRLEKSHPWK